MYDRLTFIKESKLRPFFQEEGNILDAKFTAQTVEITTDLTQEDIDFLNKLHRQIDKYMCDNYGDPSYIIVGRRMVISILRFNYKYYDGGINFDSFRDIPVVSADLPPDTFYVVGNDNRRTTLDYLTSGGTM
jgi:hypothetical protein